MANHHVDSFVRKFHELWSVGAITHLAWCGLRVQLGGLPGQGHQQVQPSGLRLLYKPIEELL